ncbi:MAG: nucleotide exchange factor GrpE [Clostridia bacterium]|nr:nucleotide exchange factor GrpE [Clostridia bacterium]
MAEEVKNSIEEQDGEQAAATAAVEELQASIESLQRELEAMNDKYVRLVAEYDNFRKRTVKEKSNAYTEAYADAVKDILPIGDVLARATAFTDPDAVSKGMAMVLKSFDDALKKMGLTEIEALGQQFDPERHNAVMHVEDDAFGENEVVEVLQKGYMYGDRVIRYAMVKVAN